RHPVLPRRDREGASRGAVEDVAGRRDRHRVCSQRPGPRTIGGRLSGPPDVRADDAGPGAGLRSRDPPRIRRPRPPDPVGWSLPGRAIRDGAHSLRRRAHARFLPGSEPSPSRGRSRSRGPAIGFRKGSVCLERAMIDGHSETLRSTPYAPLKQGMDAASLAAGILTHLEFTLGELPKHVDSRWEPYLSVALAVRDRLMERWIRTQDAYYEHDAKRVYYLSLEFLMGRTLGNSIINLGLVDECQEAVSSLGYDLEALREAEWDAGLGNGGLGRLAACFLDSLATLELPSYGYGLRYDYGIFHQRIVDGAQVETPDGWLRYGNPWEIARTGDHFTVQFGGRVYTYRNDAGRLTTRWGDTDDVLAMAYDTPGPGYRTGTVNTLPPWPARATEQVDPP